LTVHPQPTAVGALSEAELLARIFPRLSMEGSHSQATLLGPGDDAAVVAAPDGKTVISIDTQVQDQDFRLEWNNGYRTTGFDVGWKAAAQNLSDINAMGARHVPRRKPHPATRDTGRMGGGSGGRPHGRHPASWAPAACSVAGGDLGRGRELSVTVAVLGTLDGGQPVLRSGAQGRHRGHRRAGGHGLPQGWHCWSPPIMTFTFTEPAVVA
jgi:thiamine-monophosphate kinase